MKSVRLLLNIVILVFVIQPLYAQQDDEVWMKLLDDNKYAEARLVLEKQLSKSPQNDTIVGDIGFTYLQEENFEKAYEWFEKATKLNPKNTDYHLFLVGACGSDLGMLSLLTGGASKCIKHAERILEIDPHNIIAHTLLLAYYLHTPGILGGSMKKAKYYANEIMKIDSCHGYEAWASIFSYDEEYHKAEEYFRRAISIDTSSDLRSSKNFCNYYENRKKYDKALQVYEQILKKNPDNMEAVYQIGVCRLESKKNLLDAEDNFRKYLSWAKSKSKLAEGHWSLGKVFDLQSKKDSALTHLKKAVELRPKSKEYTKTLEEVQDN